MKFVINKQFENIGEEYMDETQVVVEIVKGKDFIYFTVDGVQYEIPIEILKLI